MAAKPAVKDVSIILTNAPQLMLGTRQYPLNFTVMNLRNDVKDVSLLFSSNSLKMDTPKVDLALAPQEKKTITLNVSPEKDGSIDLSVVITQNRTVKYTETVLEGQENEVVGVPAVPAGGVPTAAASTPASPAVQKPSVAPVKPSVAPVKPSVAPVKPSGATAPAPAVQKPSGTPVKPVKPAGAAAPAPAPAVQKPASGDGLEKRILSIKDKYMAARTSLQSLTQGSAEYTRTYQDALKYKEQYEKLKAIYESGGTMADAEAAVPSEAADPVAELKALGQRYNDLKNKLATLSPGTPEHDKVKQDALAVYKEYNDKRAKAKEQGLAV